MWESILGATDAESRSWEQSLAVPLLLRVNTGERPMPLAIGGTASLLGHWPRMLECSQGQLGARQSLALASPKANPETRAPASLGPWR